MQASDDAAETFPECGCDAVNVPLSHGCWTAEETGESGGWLHGIATELPAPPLHTAQLEVEQPAIVAASDTNSTEMVMAGSRSHIDAGVDEAAASERLLEEDATHATSTPDASQDPVADAAHDLPISQRKPRRARPVPNAAGGEKEKDNEEAAQAEVSAHAPSVPARKPSSKRVRAASTPTTKQPSTAAARRIQARLSEEQVEAIVEALRAAAAYARRTARSEELAPVADAAGWSIWWVPRRPAFIDDRRGDA